MVMLAVGVVFTCLAVGLLVREFLIYGDTADLALAICALGLGMVGVFLSIFDHLDIALASLILIFIPVISVVMEHNRR
jgi:hypothetical protein